MEHDYPELARRRHLLQKVDDFCRTRENPNQALHYDQIAETGEEGNLFITLVNEGYMDADLTKGSKMGPPFEFAFIRGLRTSGKQLLGELPDPTEAVLERIDAIEAAIYEVEGVSEEERRKGIDAAEELKHFARALPPGFVLQVFGNLFQ